MTNPYDPRGPTVSEDGRTGFVTVAFDTDKIELPEYERRRAATQMLRDAGIQVEYNGLLGVAKGDEEPGSEMIGIAVAIIVLAIAFGSLVAMSLPIAVALIGLLVGTQLDRHPVRLPGGAVDHHHRRHRCSGSAWASTTPCSSWPGTGRTSTTGMPVPEAVGRANATAGLSVLFAGITVVVAIASLQVAGIPMLTTMGWGSALMVGDHHARRGHPAARAARPGRPQGEQPAGAVRAAAAGQRPRHRSARWAARVVARPVRYAVVAAVLLGVLAAPAPPCGSASPTTATRCHRSTLRKSYDLLADGFGPGFNGPVQVAVEIDGSAGRHGGAARASAPRIAADRASRR